MATMEQIEIERYRDRLDKDVAELVDRYMGIMGWDIPEVNVERARGLIVAEIKAAIGRLETAGK